MLWVVDLNRQSLDRVVPDIAAGRIGAMFEAAGWQTITVKYGRLLRELFARDGGEALRARIDAMPNEEYQRLLRAARDELRERLPGRRARSDVARLLADLDDAQLRAAVRDLGGHDLADLLDAFRARRRRHRPAVGRLRLHDQGLGAADRGPSRQPLRAADRRAVRASSPPRSAPTPDDPWAPFDAGSPEAELLPRRRARGCEREPAASRDAARGARATLGRAHTRARRRPSRRSGASSPTSPTSAPEVAERVVTVSPDVASSTNLGGWINRVGIWALGDRIDWFADDTDTLVRWRESEHGQHIELGIAEVNLVGLLGELGATWSRDGQPLLPIGTIYDPFVNRALEPWSFGIYAGGQSILVGTPSGVTLGPEGGAHQSIITPSVGIEQPGCMAWEPAFGAGPRVALPARARAPRPARRHVARTSACRTRPIDQALARAARGRRCARAAPRRRARRRLPAARAGGAPA